MGLVRSVFQLRWTLVHIALCFPVTTTHFFFTLGKFGFSSALVAGGLIETDTEEILTPEPPELPAAGLRPPVAFPDPLHSVIFFYPLLTPNVPPFKDTKFF